MKYGLILATATLLLSGCSSCSPDRFSESVEFAHEPNPARGDAEVREPPADAAGQPADETPTEKSDIPAKPNTRADNAIFSENGNVRIDVHYPELGNEKLDPVIQKKAQSLAQSRKDKLEALQSANQNNPGRAFGYELSYDVTRRRGDSADIVFVHNEHTGGAHTSTELETVMLDADGKEIDPWSLFGNVDEELANMSLEARRQLKEKLSAYGAAADIDEMIRKGTEPDRQNFRHIVRTDDGFRIYFDPYTVAPGAEGVLYFDYKPL